MKRILTLFSLCWLFVGAVSAQVSYADLSETKYYYMKSGKKNASSSWNRGYIVMKSDGTNLTLQGITNAHNSWNVADYKTAFNERTAGKEAMWGVIKYTINNTTYAIIYNAKNGKCFKSTEATSNGLAAMQLADEVGYYKFESITGSNITTNSYRIRNVSTRNAGYKLALAPAQATTSNKCVAAYDGNDADGGVPICFIEVPEGNSNATFDPNIKKIVELRDIYGNATLAQTLMNRLGTYSSNEHFTALGTSLTTFNSAPTVENATNLQTAYSTLVPLNCGNDFSYEIYHCAYGVNSTVNNVLNGRGMLAYDNSRTGNNQRPVTVGVTYNGYTSKGYKNPCDEGINTRWGLYKNSDNSYYIYNEGNAARMMTAAAPSLWTENWTKLSIAANPNLANTFLIKSVTETSKAIGISLGFYQTGSGAKDQGDIRLQDNTTDDGVKLMIRIAGLANAGARNIIDAAMRRDAYPAADYGYVGSLNTDAVVTGANRTVENAQAILNAQPLAIEANKNYLIYSGYATTKYVNADPIADKEGQPQDNNRGLKFSTDASPLKAIVQFETVEDKYYIKHVNSGMYFGQLSANNQGQLPLSKEYAGKYGLETTTSGNTKFALKDATDSKYIHINGSDQLVGYGVGPNGGAAGSSVKIKLCNTIDLTLSSAGWSTFCSPVALTIPATDGLNIYYVSSIQGDAVYVKEITGTIPAKTPVLVNGNVSSTITFAIADNVPAIEGNKLMGTTMRRTGFSTNTNGNPDVFGLKVSDTSASFVPAYSETLPANKAMLPYENIVASGSPASATSAFRLEFDENGATTGIDNALCQPTDRGVLRDLNGRIVAYPVRGQVYIQSNGQKIILK